MELWREKKEADWVTITKAITESLQATQILWNGLNGNWILQWKDRKEKSVSQSHNTSCWRHLLHRQPQKFKSVNYTVAGKLTAGTLASWQHASTSHKSSSGFFLFALCGAVFSPAGISLSGLYIISFNWQLLEMGKVLWASKCGNWHLERESTPLNYS